MVLMFPLKTLMWVAIDDRFDYIRSRIIELLIILQEMLILASENGNLEIVERIFASKFEDLTRDIDGNAKNAVSLHVLSYVIRNLCFTE